MLERSTAIVLLLTLIYPGVSMAEEFMRALPEGFAPPSAEDEYDQRLLDDVKRVGWHTLHIQAEEGSPPFSFTVGHFYKENHPEIIVIGLKPETAQQLLDIAALKIAGGKARIEPHREYSDFTESLSLRFIPVSLEHYREYLGYANWFYGSLPGPYPALQMVWPDKAGRFPWEPGFDTTFAPLQPILGKTP